MRLAKIIVYVKFYFSDDKNFQIFTTEIITGGNKRDLKYLHLQGYTIYDKYKAERQNRSLSWLDDRFVFREEIKEGNKTILVFDGPKIKLKNYRFVLSGFVPPNPGCAYCKYKKQDGDFVFCSFMSKTLTRYKKRCRFFRQRNLN